MSVEEKNTSLAEIQAARRALLQARSRDEIIEALLEFVSSRSEYAAVFSVSAGEIQGRDAVGPYSRGAHRADARRLSVRPPWGSMFRSAMEVGSQLVGPAPTHPFDKVVLGDLGREAPAGTLMVPVRVRGRTAMLLYADSGPKELDPERVVDVVTLCAALPAALEALIRRRKEEGPGEAGAEKALLSDVAEALVDAPFEALSLEPLLPAPTLVEEKGAAVEKASSPKASGESLEEKGMDPAKLDPPEVIAARLSLGGEAEPRLLVALAAHGDAGARALADCFPGPTRERSLSFAAMEPDPMAHGPVVAAMAFLGPAATGTLLSLTSSEKPDARLYSAFLLCVNPDYRALPRLIEMLSDSDRRAATAARAALLAHRGVPGYHEAVGELRGELGRRDDPVRLCDVLRALSLVGDPRSVPRIVDLLDHGDREVVAEAEAALVAITKQSHGTSPRRWLKWYEANRRRPRVAWLVDGLSSRTSEVRESAIRELSEEVGETFDFEEDGSRGGRSRSIERWREWLKAVTGEG